MTVTEEQTNFFKDLADTVTDKVAGFVDKVAPKQKVYTPLLPITDNLVIPANLSFGVMRLGAPTKGHFWYVRMLRIAGVGGLLPASSAVQQFSNNNSSNNIQDVLTVPAGQTWNNIQAIGFSLITDATAGNRSLQIVVRDNLNRTIAQYTFVTTQGPSLARSYQSLNGVSTDTLSGTTVTFPNILQGMTLGAGYSITVQTTAGAGVGDSYAQTLFAIGTAASGANAGTATIFVGPDDMRSVASLGQIPIGMWRDQIISLPGVNVYSHGALRIASQEALYVALSNGTPLQQYVASAEVYQYPDSDESLEWVI